MIDVSRLFLELEEISRKGVSVVVKIDGERWGDPCPKPFTVMVFGGAFKAENSFKIDSDSLEEALIAGIEHSKINSF